MEEKQKKAIQHSSPKTESTLSKTVKATKQKNVKYVSLSTMKKKEKCKRQYF